MKHNPLSEWRRGQTARGVPRRPSEGNTYFPQGDALRQHEGQALCSKTLSRSEDGKVDFLLNFNVSFRVFQKQIFSD
jgi:hypothetical protein